MTELKKGEYADIEVLLACRALTANEIGTADNIRVEKLDDAFIYGVDTSVNAAWDGVPKVELLTSGDAPLQIRVLFPHLLRQGDGKNLRFRISYLGLSLKSRTVKIKIQELVKDTTENAGEAETGEAETGETTPVSRPQVDKCRVLIDGKVRKSLIPAQTADLSITFRNNGLTRKDLGENGLTVEKLEDDFQAGDAGPRVEILSKDSKPLKARITFPGLTYLGGDSSLRFKVSYDGLGLPGEIIRVDVRQCDAKAAPAREKGDGTDAEPQVRAAADSGNAPVLVQPALQISRETMTALSSGQSAAVTLTFKNNGSLPVRRVSAVFSPSGALVLGESTATLQIADEIKPGESASRAVKLLVNGEVSSPMQPLGVEAKFEYDGEETALQGGASETVLIPTVITPSKPEVPVETPSIPAPSVKIFRGPMETVRAGQTFSVSLTVKNLGRTAMETPVLIITPTDSLMLLESTASLELPRIPAGQSTQATVRMKALEEIQSPSQGFTAEVKFDYSASSGLQNASSTETVLIPVTADIKDANLPAVIISRAPFIKPIKAGQSFSATVYVKNVGKRAVESGMITLTTSDGIMLKEDSSTVQIGRVEPGAQLEITVDLKALKQISAQVQSLGLELKYDYLKGRAMEHETASERVLIPAVITKQKSGGSSAKETIDSPTPNIIVTGYSAGADQVAAGSKFSLALTFQNTSPAKTVENIVMTLETGESFTITDASNTFYYSSLGPGQTQSETIKMQALPVAKSGSGKMDVSFKYEYVDNKKRSSTNITEKLSVPVYQPDRFNLTDPTLPESVEMGEETVVSIPYVNKGKSEVSNLEAEITGNIPALSKSVTLGNLEPGKSGTIDFILTPDTAGQQDATVKISYEDANQAVVQHEIPVSLHVSDPMEGMDGTDDLSGAAEYDGDGEYDGEYGGEHGALPFGLEIWHLYVLGGCVTLLLLALIMVRRHKKKIRAAALKKFSFEGEDDDGSGEGK
ncbi:COG1361 S-layer family protein [Bacillota bacterium Meth-B3]